MENLIGTVLSLVLLILEDIFLLGDDVFQKEIDKQVILAIDEADVILFIS